MSQVYILSKTQKLGFSLRTVAAILDFAKMTLIEQNNTRNELSTSKSVGLEVLQVIILSNTQKLGLSLQPMAAILDSAITQNVPGWCPINSVIFHVWVPLDSNQVRNSLNSEMYTGLLNKYRTTCYIFSL
jgi:hypothetical protein